MFRYGGPIKEGVMSGIREPKRNGGSMMGNDPTGTGLVGDQRYPKTDGREHHWFTLAGTGAMAGIRALSGMAAKKATQKIATSGAGTMGTGAASGAARSVPTIIGKNAAGAANAAKPGFFKSLFLDDPLVKAGMYGYKALTGAGAKSFGQKAVRFAISPSSIIAGTAYYMWPDGKERTDPPPESTEGKLGDGLVEQAKKLSPEEIKAAENKARMEKMDSYREIMDIKGMNKDAAYKSLIDASKIIQEGGNLKKQLKDGSLISKVTAAASKNFDKVNATENALSSLLVKSKIESDLRAEQGGPLMQQAKDLVNAGGAANIKEAMEYLSKKPSIVQTATDYAKKFGKGFVDQDTAILAIQETFKKRATPVITEKLFEEYKKADGYTTVIDLFEKLKGQKKLGEGYYVIGGNGFVVDERGNTKQVL
jgi:hypothetical protein